MWQNLSVLDQTPVQIGSWTIQGHPASGDTAPYFEATYNGSGAAPALYGYFEIPKGSFVSVEDTTWDSPLDFAADIMEVYKCALCPTNRRPTDKHQTFPDWQVLDFFCFNIFSGLHGLLCRTNHPVQKQGKNHNQNNSIHMSDHHSCQSHHANNHCYQYRKWEFFL